MVKLRIYLVESDAQFGELLQQWLLLNTDYEIMLFRTTADCLSAENVLPNLICIDYKLSGLSCKQFLLEMRSCNIKIPVIIFNGINDATIAVELLKLGAKDYILENEPITERLLNFMDTLSINIYLTDEVESHTNPSKINSDDKLKINQRNNESMSNFNKSITLPDMLSIVPEQTLREYMIAVIVCYLDKYNRNVVKTAEKLDISKSTIYSMIKSGEITLNK